MDCAEVFKQAFEYLKQTGVIRNQGQFANAIGVDNALVSRALRGEYKVQEKHLWKINSAFPNVFSWDWLLSGEGEMLADKNTVQTLSNIANTTMQNINVGGGTSGSRMDRSLVNTVRELVDENKRLLSLMEEEKRNMAHTQEHLGRVLALLEQQSVKSSSVTKTFNEGDVN